MKALIGAVVMAVSGGALAAAPVVHDEVFGRTLGGWNAKRGKASDYEISGTKYRTWRPHVSPTVDGGIFVSVRIDHVRGIFASDDHAVLELGFDQNGEIVSAQSTIALQGRKITSDVIQGGTKFGTNVVGVDRVVKVGTDLIGSLTAKMLREKVTEPGRVGFPAAVRHNYNLLCLAIGNQENRAVPLNGIPAVQVPPEPDKPEPEPDKPDVPAEEPAAPEAVVPPEETPKLQPPLKINEQGKKPAAPKADLPVPK
jgi:hypothetical protein